MSLQNNIIWFIGTPDFFDVIGQVSWYEPEA